MKTLSSTEINLVSGGMGSMAEMGQHVLYSAIAAGVGMAFGSMLNNDNQSFDIDKTLTTIALTALVCRSGLDLSEMAANLLKKTKVGA